ncbi:flagellar hook-basal body protein [Novosphingobium sp. FKTRR1]|uniref:flagellar hook-basal body protein n=1 Tax=Novosphingobium sp. FKTRR1 TaxID=2879118 RepID=UPI001CF0013D|nr:flagellar hook basal-body protein [Novosphingobium sp. FKTRR1]
MSFYTALTGLKNAQTSLSVTSHNIANSETNGFKKSRVQFSDIVAGSAFTNPRLLQGIGSTVKAITQNFAQGPIEQTGSALDLSVNGDGFFTTKTVTGAQTYFTRNGAFEIDGGGYIIDGSSNRLQVFATDSAGNLTTTPPTMTDALVPQTSLPNGAGSAFAGVTVADNGNVTASYADGTNQVVGKITLATFISSQGLKQEGSSNWTATGISGVAVYGEPTVGQYGKLLSGSLERSNVDISEEMVSLITAQRDFQANAKTIDTTTQIATTIINLRT